MTDEEKLLRSEMEKAIARVNAVMQRAANEGMEARVTVFWGGYGKPDRKGEQFVAPQIDIELVNLKS